jgi:hypothetical protein
MTAQVPNTARRGFERSRLAVRLAVSVGLLFVALASQKTALAQTWTQQNPASPPSGREYAATAYDPVHQQVVLFGGLSADATPVPLGDTWVWDGVTWTQVAKSPATAPAARYGASMVWDSGHQEMVLFGGGTSGTQFGDTWTWNGATWTEASTTGPGARQYPAMAYDANHNQTVLFGGETSGPPAPLRDTWLWNGTSWSQVNPATPPSASFGAAMTYDPVRKNVIMFGGNVSGGTATNPTWTWDGSSWTQASPSTNPPAAANPSLAFDPELRVSVLFGLSDGDTWNWNGSNWVKQVTSGSPSARTAAAMAFDSAQSQLVLFGGTTGSSTLGDTWTETLSFTENWVQFYETSKPTARFQAAVSNDPISGNLFMFGGSTGSSLLGDVTEWFGAEWATIVGGTFPSARWGAGAALDTQDGQTIMFGGSGDVSGGTLLNETWTWDGTGWTQQTTSGSPSQRMAPAMAFDPRNGTTVLFGGNSSSGAMSDTWLFTFNTLTWSQQNPSHSPTARSGASVVYDAARGQILMFGGANAGTYLKDTWVWDGADWTQENPATDPAARANAAMVFDAAHGVVGLSGGIGSSGPLGDTWTWNGSNWTKLSSAGPPARYGAAMAYSPNTQVGAEIVLFGGTPDGHAPLSDSWIFDAPATTNSVLPIMSFGVPFDYVIPVTGGSGPYTFSADGFPFSFASFGLALNTSTGEITGIPTVVNGQSGQIGVTVTDSQGLATDVPFTFESDAPLVLSPSGAQIPPDATAGTSYLVQLSATGGTAPYTFAVTGAPAGLSLNGSNQLTGKCTASSNDVTISVSDSMTPVPQTVSESVSIYFNPSPQITNSSPLTGGTVGSNYNVQLMTNAVHDAPGAAPYLWSVPPGTLPAGLSLTSTGQITGVPTTTTTATFTVTFTDAWAATISKQFSLTIAPKSAAVANVSPTMINFGTLYLGQVSVKTVTVKNTGTAPLAISNPFLSLVKGGNSNEFFALNLCPSSLGAGKSCTITITFTAGPYYIAQTATLNVMDNAANSPQQVTLTAQVMDPIASYNPSVLSFGTQKVKTATTETITLTNIGATVLNLNGMAVTGPNASDFTTTTTCLSTVNPGKNCKINVKFVPSAKGLRSATLRVSDNEVVPTQFVLLSGTGK